MHSSIFDKAKTSLLAFALVIGTLSVGAFATATPSHAVVYCRAGVYVAGCVRRPAAPAARVVYCTGPGYPRGCVVRRSTAPVVYCKRVGYPKGCVARY